MHKRLSILFVGVALAALAVPSMAQTKSEDPWIGTWKVNLDKSTFSGGMKPPAGTVKIEKSGTGMKTTISMTSPQGEAASTETVWMFDGKDYPVKGAPAPNTTAAYKRVDARTFEVTTKVDGTAMMTTRVSISPDGKAMVATQSGKSSDGQPVKNVVVAEKQ